MYQVHNDLNITFGTPQLQNIFFCLMRKIMVIPYKILTLKWWLLQLILVLWLAAKQNINSLFTTMTDVLSNQIFLAYIFEFEYMPSSLSFCWHFFLRGRSFVFGASQSCRPPVNLLLGLKGKITENNQLKLICLLVEDELCCVVYCLVFSVHDIS